MPARERPALGRRARRSRAHSRRPIHDSARHAALVPCRRRRRDRVGVLDAQPRRDRRLHRSADRSIAPSASSSSTSPGRPLTPTAPIRSLALEHGDTAEEEREERVEARPLDRVVLHLLGQLAGRAGIAPGRRVGLALGVQPRVGRRAVHRRGGDQLAVGVRDEDRDRAGGVRDDVVDDRPGSGEAHPSSLDLRRAMTAVAIRGTTYPVVLPKLSDPRLHLAATITSLQVIGPGRVPFPALDRADPLSLGTCAVLEIAITLRKQHVLMWPASALLTGNGVAFVLRVPGDAARRLVEPPRLVDLRRGRAAVSLLSKYVIKWRGEHIFNPSNIGLVLCFLDPRPRPRRAARLLVGPDVVVDGARARDHRHRRLHDPARGSSCCASRSASGRRSPPASACSRSRATR